MSPFHFRLSAAKNLSSFQLLPASLITDLLQLFLGCHVNSWSKCKPRYVTSLFIGIGILWIVICGQTMRLVVKVIWVDFVFQLNLDTGCDVKVDLVEADCEHTEQMTLREF